MKNSSGNLPQKPGNWITRFLKLPPSANQFGENKHTGKPFRKRLSYPRYHLLQNSIYSTGINLTQLRLSIVNP